jgi:hypothetical protein
VPVIGVADEIECRGSGIILFVGTGVASYAVYAVVVAFLTGGVSIG